jgi:hypothetical protein
MEMKLGTRLWLAAMVWGGVLASCSSDPTFADSECATCLKDVCAVSYDACAGEPGCAAFLSCLDDCPESEAGLPVASCEAECAKPDGSAAATLLSDYLACRDVGPGHRECESCTGGEVPCYACARKACEQELNACYDDPACLAYQQCTLDCEDANPPPNNVLCLDACGQAADPATVLLARTSELCTLPPCVSECLAEPSPCVECIVAQCWTEHSNCQVVPECARLDACVADCFYAQDQSSCVAACTSSAPPQALSLYQATETCLVTTCNC